MCGPCFYWRVKRKPRRASGAAGSWHCIHDPGALWQSSTYDSCIPITAARPIRADSVIDYCALQVSIIASEYSPVPSLPSTLPTVRGARFGHEAVGRPLDEMRSVAPCSSLWFKSAQGRKWHYAWQLLTSSQAEPKMIHHQRSLSAAFRLRQRYLSPVGPRHALGGSYVFPTLLAPLGPHPAPRRTHTSYRVSSEPSQRGFRVSTVFTALFALGIFGLGYGIYDLYSMFTTWPSEMRSDLRSALRAKAQGDFSTSEKYFKRAYATAISFPDPSAKLGKDHLLMITGISLALGDVLESTDQEAAYSVYSTTLADLQLGGSGGLSNGSSTMNPKERVRAIGTALKLAEIGEQLSTVSDEEVEGHLTWALEEMLRNIKGQTDGAKNPTGEGPKEADLALPRFCDGVDLGDVLERLAEFYSKRGKVEYAVPLYLHAISILIPPAALLMNNLSSIFASPSPGAKINLPQALEWSKKALEVAQKASKDFSGSAVVEKVECQTTVAVVLFNLGMLNEMSKETNLAKEYFKLALEQSRDVGMKEGVQEAKAALRRLNSAT